MVEKEIKFSPIYDNFSKLWDIFGKFWDFFDILQTFWLFCTMQRRESEMNRAAAALSWSSLLATPHSLLTSHDRRDDHRWTMTARNKTVQFARKPHAVNLLHREGGHLGVEGSMLESVRPVLELVLVSWALDRDNNTFFLHPDILATQVLS